MTSRERVTRRGPPELRPLGKVLDFLRRVWALDHALQRTSKRMNADLGVTGPQRLVIRIVGRFPGIPPGQLASILHLHPSTVTGILDRLVRRRLVSRRLDPRDRRRARLELTTKGRALDVAGPGTVEAAVSSALSVLPPAKVRDAAAVLRRLAEELEAAGRG